MAVVRGHDGVLRRTFVIVLFVSFLGALTSCSGYRSTVVPRLAVNEQYTDNINLSSSNRESDFLTVVSPGVTYGLTGRNKELTLSLDPSFTYYAKREGHTSTRLAADLDASSQVSRHSRIEISETFTRTDDPTPPTEPSFTRTDLPPPFQDTTIRRNREPYFTNSTEARYRYELAPDGHFYLGHRWEILDNEDPTLENNTRQTPSFGTTYWFTQDYGIENRTSYTRGDFSLDSPSINELFSSLRVMRRLTRSLDVFVQYSLTNEDFEGGERPDYRIHDASAGVDYHLSQTTFLTLSGGYYFRDEDREELTSGYVLRGDMAKTFSRGSVRLSGGMGYDQAFFGAENLGFTEYYESNLAGTYSFTRRLTGEVSGSYRLSMYQDVVGREDNVITADASLSYLVRTWLTASLGVSRRTVDSNAPGRSYDENRITLSVTVTPPRPILLE